MTDTRPGDTYTHGHHESVLRSHRWRTAENSAGYLLDELKPGVDVLDIGCGPATITLDFANRVAPGTVVGVDNAADPLIGARAEADQLALDNVIFEQASVYDLPFPDDSFNVVHAHQVLQHLTNPVAALREMHRVCRPGGTVAARDADFAAMAWFPHIPALDRWLDVYNQITRSNNTEPNAGRQLHAWASAAGFDHVTCTASAWCFASAQQRSWWGGLWADRVRVSSLAQQARESDIASQAELDEIARGWLDWAARPDGWFSVLNGEIRCRA